MEIFHRKSTIYVPKLFNADIIRDSRIGFPTTTAKDNSLLYEKAISLLVKWEAGS